MRRFTPLLIIGALLIFVFVIGIIYGDSNVNSFWNPVEPPSLNNHSQWLPIPPGGGDTDLTQWLPIPPGGGDTDLTQWLPIPPGGGDSDLTQWLPIPPGGGDSDLT